MSKLKVISYLVLFLLLFGTSQAQFYNGMNDDFGKNRVQYKDFLWNFYKYQEFDVYYYRGGQNLALYTAKAADKNLRDLESFFDYKLDDKIQFIVYNNQSDFYQSNIGNVSSEQNVGGQTRLVGSKVFIYYDGNHQHLQEQIRSGISQMIIHHIVYGGTLSESVKSNALISLPIWFESGLTAFVSDTNNLIIQSENAEAISNDRYEDFNALSSQDQVKAGYGLWKYIHDTYGANAVPNIVYMSKLNNDAESGFLFALGMSQQEIITEWLFREKGRLNKASKTAKNKMMGEPFLKKTKDKRTYYQFEISPDEKYIAYITNELQQYKIWLFDKEKGKAKKLDRQNFKLDIDPDLSNPLLEWHPNGQFLSIIREYKGKFLWQLYDVNSEEWTESELFDFDKIMDYSYSSDGKHFAIVALKNGKTDLFEFKIQGRIVNQITDDYYDEFNPVFINGDREILFASNRINDSLEVGGKQVDLYAPSTDLFVYNREKSSKVLERITDTPNSSEWSPQVIKGNYFTYLSDDSRSINEYIGRYDSVLTHIDTVAHYAYDIKTKAISNRTQGLISHSVNSINHQKIRLYRLKNKSIPTLEKVKGYDDYSLNPTSELFKAIPEQALFYFQAPSFRDSFEVDITDYRFESDSVQQKTKEKEEEKGMIVFTIQGEDGETETRILNNPSRKDSVKRKKKDRHVFENARIYNVTFQPDYLVTQFDNAFLNPMYQRYTGGAFYPNPNFNAFFKVGTSDVLEDYKIIGGFRYGGSSNNESFVSFQNLKKRFDHQYIYHRLVAEQELSPVDFRKMISDEVTYKVEFPFSMTSRLGLAPSLRVDRFIALTSNQFNLEEPDIFDFWARTKAEYVFDNTRNKGVNLMHGSRMKVFGESFYNLRSDKPWMFVLGLDARNYIKVHKQIIWANRIAASTSFGQQKLLYYLGGVDNWLFPQFNRNMQVPPEEPFAFQTVATNMRGFQQNIRNGHSFAVINSELRWPIFQYFSKKPLRKEFFRTFQAVGFADVGSAWTGAHPFDEENDLNVQTIVDGPVTVTYLTQIEPIVEGVGFGARAKLFGYFVRADWAWGIEDGRIKGRQFYLSLNLDF